MIYNPKTPIIIGVLLIFAIVAALTFYSPMPGELSQAHAHLNEMESIEGCQTCHGPQNKFEKNCLSCHTEIQSQYLTDTGYHAYLKRQGQSDCQTCHSEHQSREFNLINEVAWGAQTSRAFKHPHVEFHLNEAHENLACEACHTKKLQKQFTLEGFPNKPRAKTFLGMTQQCKHCHSDVHSGGFSQDCASCHGQKSFHPTENFDHDAHFPLKGGHAKLDCKHCHNLPEPNTPHRPAPFPFDRVKGANCQDCHQNPHRALFSDNCAQCHDGNSPTWSSAVDQMSRDNHALTGFSLSHPHTQVECASCHPRELESSKRYQNPHDPDYNRSQDSCQGCHQDAHQGQFKGRHDACRTCHTQTDFRPTTFTHEAHSRTFDLSGPHEAVACTNCHLLDSKTGIRQFKGTSRECKSCHENPHGQQFKFVIESGDCNSCHTAKAHSFEIRKFNHTAIARYALKGAHAMASCESCHIEVVDNKNGKVRTLRRYRGTPRNCDGCHTDVHRGQFKDRGEKSCSTCHNSFNLWAALNFNHDTDTRFPLEGTHREVECSRCHLEVKTPPKGSVIQYKPLGRECGDCHEFRKQ